MTAITMKRKHRIADARKQKARSRNKKIVAATAAGTITALLLANGKAGACSTEYTVKKNDTLYSLAKKYEVTVEQLMEANALASDKIMAGQQLLVPDKPNHNELFSYTVKRGDTLYSLAKQHGMTVEEITYLNKKASDQIKIGEDLSLPAGQSSSEVGEFYTVLPGDTLWGISHRYGLKPESVAKANGLQLDMVLIGQNLFIPGEAEVSQAAIIGAVDSFSVEFKDDKEEFVLKVPYGTAESYQKKSGQLVTVIHKNGAVISVN
ncbi:LysM peptidoglycan-binding domain-containing protein [Rossellomorea aquimaris]|uniref:LysM peptidoglycan-binding domain-containing protein n=1 Tax=Rossellomorea aquimaris TaxID=189382 RepID=UPI001CD23F2A|nr:LysM peptidoglycan-binding domain-containing protein [Rossellomorea aquimaris]MCA1055432.1 LysM peptidoglycan-binding domain-containing protein [Rossellomorea aquimaris]